MCTDIIRNAYFYVRKIQYFQYIGMEDYNILQERPIFTQRVTCYKEWKFLSQLVYGKIKILCIYVQYLVV